MFKVNYKNLTTTAQVNHMKWVKNIKWLFVFLMNKENPIYLDEARTREH